jgi:hypothetical protein
LPSPRCSSNRRIVALISAEVGCRFAAGMLIR